MDRSRTTYVALLRGVNVGGRNRLAMADLRAILESLGHAHVRTYIQSGNAIFTTDASGEAGSETALASTIRAGIADRVGLEVDVIVRSRDDLAEALAAVPFRAADPKRLLIAFLAETPSEGTPAARSRIDRGGAGGRPGHRPDRLPRPAGRGRPERARPAVRATSSRSARPPGTWTLSGPCWPWPTTPTEPADR